MVKNSETNKNSTYQIIVNREEAKGDATAVSNQAMKKAHKIRNIVIGLFAFIIISITFFFIIKHKRNQKEAMEDSKYEFEDEMENDLDDDSQEDSLNLDGEEELFKRVNKEKFKIAQNNNDTELTKQFVKNEENKDKLEDNYFKNSDEQRKGKHF